MWYIIWNSQTINKIIVFRGKKEKEKSLSKLQAGWAASLTSNVLWPSLLRHCSYPSICLHNLIKLCVVVPALHMHMVWVGSVTNSTFSVWLWCFIGAVKLLGGGVCLLQVGHQGVSTLVWASFPCWHTKCHEEPSGTHTTHKLYQPCLLQWLKTSETSNQNRTDPTPLSCSCLTSTSWGWDRGLTHRSWSISC